MVRYGIWTFLILMNAVAGVASAAPDNRVGVRSLTALAPTRGQAVELALWYPTASEGSPEPVGENKIFKGMPALRNAPIADGRYPVILVAHGGFRSAPNHEGWIAAYLAARGYIVGVTRPPTLGPRDAQRALPEIWLRPTDLSAALTAIEGDPLLSSRIDPANAAVVGFFLGGTSALAVVGGRIDAESYMRTCDKPEAGVDCAWFAKNGVDLRKVDATHLSRSHLDRRIRAAVAVDPELSKSFAATSLAEIKVPVDIINLGRPGKITAALEASSLAKSIPGARYETVPDAVTYDAFSACMPKGAALLREDGDDDVICREGKRSRQEIHLEIAEKIEAALRRGLAHR
jgi:predicted dienelactone hydrolase